jgi:hypothetical protein
MMFVRLVYLVFLVLSSRENPGQAEEKKKHPGDEGSEPGDGTQSRGRRQIAHK